ncbi:MAG TPA: hypothetical protein VN634_05495 [Candidatus Limnocylindrales bacterium]|nr:hypothetical protein [Candidatus Limnocylindrales bacterium]
MATTILRIVSVPLIGLCALADVTAVPSYAGPLSSAGPSLSEVVDGACCTHEGLCYDFTPQQCEGFGVYQGDGTICDIGVCPDLSNGACCTPDGLCYDFTPQQCEGFGVYQGDGTICDIGVCPGITTTTLSDDTICGDADMDGQIKASDALVALRAAIGSAQCIVERCDYDGSGKVRAADALAILKRAVGQPIVPMCPGV